MQSNELKDSVKFSFSSFSSRFVFLQLQAVMAMKYSIGEYFIREAVKMLVCQATETAELRTRVAIINM